MYVPATAKSHKKRDQRKASGRARQLCTSRLGSGLHLYPHALPRTPGEPRGPMRQYVPIIFSHIPFHSLVLDRDPPPSSLSMDHGLHRGYTYLPSPNRPCVLAHTRVMNLSVRVRVHKRTTADSG